MAKHEGKKESGKGPQMTKKETGFGAKLGKHHGKGPEGPAKGMKK